MTQTLGILQKILATKLEEVSRRKLRIPSRLLEAIAKSVETPHGFYQALQARMLAKKPAIIAEIKKASPTAKA